MTWCFTIINNRLAEVFFEKDESGTKFLGHAYVNESEYTTKKEKEYIRKDTARVRLVYRNGEYKEKR